MRYRLLTCLLSGLLPVLAGAQGEVVRMPGSFIRQLQQRDSVLIADQLVYGFRMEGVPDSVRFAYPELPQPLMENLVTVSPWQVDTVKVHKSRKGGPKTFDIVSYIVVAPFEPGRYELPPLCVERIGKDGPADTLVFDPQVLDVTTIQIDTATFVPHDIKGQIRYPVTLRELFPYILGFYLLAGAVVAAVCWMKIRRKRREDPAFREPAHITALRKLDKFRGDKFWEPERQKHFYSGVTDTLREYMAARYGIGAMEMTTAEIFSGLRETDLPEELYREMKELFERADFVKFAKYVASKEDNASVLPQAVRFVTETYRAEVESEAESQEASAEEKPAVRREENAEDYMPKEGR